MRYRSQFGGREMKRARKLWGRGPWDHEPDAANFIYAGYRCRAQRASLGNWCGYVAVLEGHPWYGHPYGWHDVRVHGGLTFSEPASSGVWVVGFDCAHFMDEIPFSAGRLAQGLPGALRRRLRGYERRRAIMRYSEYRTLGYVLDEIKRLAEQAREALR